MNSNLIYAIRNITKNLTNSVITVVGLSVAIACCLLIYFYVNQEYSFNNFHKNADRIFRLNYELNYVDGTEKVVFVEPELSRVLKDKVPQIEKSTEYRSARGRTLKYNNLFYDADMGYTEKDFFDMFSFTLIAGNKDDLFKNRHEIVITKKLADKLLTRDINTYSKLLGHAVEFPLHYGVQQFSITGILDDIPQNSTIQFDGVIPGDNGNRFGGCDNNIGYASVFYQVKENLNSAEVGKNVNNVINEYYASRIERLQNENKLIKSDNAFTPFVISLRDTYLENDIGSCTERSSNRRNSIILIAIGTLILIIACSNYTILTLGQYVKKMEDVGVRKAMGAGRSNIFSIFFFEGMVITFAAFIFGIILCFILFPVFGRLAQTEIYTELINIPGVFVFVLISFFAIVVLTSLIPVLVFFNVSPNQMTGRKLTVGKKGFISQLFISFQYSLSIILIIITIFIVRQSNYLKYKSLGLTSKNIINIDIYRMENDQKFLFRDMLGEHAGVMDLTLSSRNFLGGNSNYYINKGDGEQILVYRFKVDPQYISTLGLQLIRGENFEESNMKIGDRSMIVNEKFIEAFGIREDPLGRTYNMNGVDFTIMGVVKDFHFRDMKKRIDPAMLCTRLNWGNPYNNILLKYHPEQISNVIRYIKKCYKKTAPGKTLSYSFWDEELGKRYEEEERWSKIIGYAAILAIIISSLGLFGLTILLINQRIKEIGVRKVNGARASQVLVTINKSFIIWLIGSLLIAGPLAYYIVITWLESFPFKVSVSWWVFTMAGLVALIIAVFTVSWQSWKAAMRNPVEALRYE